MSAPLTIHIIKDSSENLPIFEPYSYILWIKLCLGKLLKKILIKSIRPVGLLPKSNVPIFLKNFY